MKNNLYLRFVYNLQFFRTCVYKCRLFQSVDTYQKYSMIKVWLFKQTISDQDQKARYICLDSVKNGDFFLKYGTIIFVKCRSCKRLNNKIVFSRYSWPEIDYCNILKSTVFFKSFYLQILIVNMRYTVLKIRIVKSLQSN